MIDDPVKTSALIARLKGALPFAAGLTPQLRLTLSSRSPGAAVPERCAVADIFYMGEEGGICCALDIGGPDAGETNIVSLTHLRLDRRSPLFREVEAYQRHRVKKLKRQAGRG